MNGPDGSIRLGATKQSNGNEPMTYRHTAQDDQRRSAWRGGRLTSATATSASRVSDIDADFEPMSEDDSEMTMREYYVQEGFDPDELTHPRDVQADDITDDTLVVAETVVRNPDIDGPATTRDIDVWGVKDVVPTDEVADFTDGAVSYPDETPVTHGVVWAYQTGDIPKFASIGYGPEMYGQDSDFEDPQRWNRLRSHVWGLSDDFIRFDLAGKYADD